MLGLAITVVAFIVERRILKALKPSPIESSREAQLSATKQVNNQAHG